MTERTAALVTGGSRGIGRAVCLELARRGHSVIINYKSNAEAAAETLRLVREAGGDGETIQFDVGDFEASQQAIKEILAREEKVGILVNNAGVTADGLLAMMSRDKWDAVIRTSLDGWYNVTRPVLRKMIRARAGAIVSMSSVSGLAGNRGQVNYSAAKAGIIAASRALAAEVGRLNIRVNVVAPGLIDTDMAKEAPVDIIKKMIPMARLGTAEEVAKVVAFLCSKDASYVTGQVISPNGGMF